MNSKLWWRIPLILFSVLMVATVIVFGKVAYAASGMPEFAQILTAATNGLKAYFEWLLEVLTLIW